MVRCVHRGGPMNTGLASVLGAVVGAVIAGTSCGQSCAPTWTTVNTVGPSARAFTAMAYDSAHSRTVLFGGWNDSVGTTGDTWTWSGTAWTIRSASGPVRRSAHAMAYDSARGRVVLFGGSDGNGTNSGNPVTPETWEWDGSTWSLVATTGP